MKTSLGIKDSERFGPLTCCSPSGKKGEKDPVSFPSLDIRGSQIEALGLKDAQVGDRYKVELEFVVTRNEMSDCDGKKTHSMGVSLKDVTSEAEQIESDEEDVPVEEEEDATAKYRKGPKPPKSVSPKEAGLAMDDEEDEGEEES